MPDGTSHDHPGGDWETELDELREALQGLTMAENTQFVEEALKCGGKQFDAVVGRLAAQLFDDASLANGPMPYEADAVACQLHLKGIDAVFLHPGGLQVIRNDPFLRLVLIQHIVSELHAQELWLVQEYSQRFRGDRAAPAMHVSNIPIGFHTGAHQLDASFIDLCAVLNLSPPADDEQPVQTIERFFQAAVRLAINAENPAASDVAEQRAPRAMRPAVANAFPPLLNRCDYSASHLARLTQLNEAMRNEYATRREMLLKRFEVQLAAFSWSASAPAAGVAAAAAACRERIPPLTLIAVDDAFDATQELLSALRPKAVRTGSKAAIKKVLIGHVPDRGGRAAETSFLRQTLEAQDRQQGACNQERHANCVPFSGGERSRSDGRSKADGRGRAGGRGCARTDGGADGHHEAKGLGGAAISGEADGRGAVGVDADMLRSSSCEARSCSSERLGLRMDRLLPSCKERQRTAHDATPSCSADSDKRGRGAAEKQRGCGRQRARWKSTGRGGSIAAARQPGIMPGGNAAS